MKLVVAIIRPERVNEVLEALYRTEVRGFSLSRSSLSYLNQLLTQRITPTDDRLQRRAFAGNLRGN